jgi:cytochrome c oxidase subunit III
LPQRDGPSTSNLIIAMPRSTPTSSRSTGHNGDLLPPFTGGGDGNRDGGDSKPDFMPNYGERLRRARLGLAVAMTPILMLFLSFSAVYLVRRGFFSFDIGSGAYIRVWAPVQLPWLLLLANTLLLISSSITIDFARREITREAALAPVRSIPGVSLGDERRFPWLALTTVLGLLFLIGQLWLWRDLSVRGFHLTGGTSSSFVYVLTAMHGVHLAGGVIALLFAWVASLLNRPPVENRRIIVDITSWYWHAMTGIWIYILVLFSFAAQ